MLHRVAQFGRAILARVDQEEKAAVERLLPEAAARAFARMPVQDQRHGLDILAALQAQGLQGAGAGLLSVAAYLAGLWAISMLPMGPVTAVRETSVVFGAMVGVLVFREGHGPRRIAAACLVACGIGLLALG